MKVTGTEDAVATGGDVAVFRDGDPDQDSPAQEVVDEAAEPSTVPRFSPRTVHPQRRWTSISTLLQVGVDVITVLPAAADGFVGLQGSSGGSFSITTVDMVARMPLWLTVTLSSACGGGLPGGSWVTSLPRLRCIWPPEATLGFIRRSAGPLRAQVSAACR
ncbi:hypothetical protein [Streptosporangium sp. NPDC049644]|uniref:hypothetical protein n=1 Tax=Streptosporangium sp. NPDC049644 TaxID=3155507 RepID=UPI003420E9B1